MQFPFLTVTCTELFAVINKQDTFRKTAAQIEEKPDFQIGKTENHIRYQIQKPISIFYGNRKPNAKIRKIHKVRWTEALKPKNRKKKQQSNLDKCSLAHETIVNIKCVVPYWLRKRPRKSQLHCQKHSRVFLFSKILARFIFLFAHGDAWSNCWLWDRFGFLHDQSLFSAL